MKNNKIKTVRVWKLGNSAQGIYPTKKVVKRLLKILKGLDLPKGSSDIIWDDMISVTTVRLDEDE